MEKLVPEDAPRCGCDGARRIDECMNNCGNGAHPRPRRTAPEPVVPYRHWREEQRIVTRISMSLVIHVGPSSRKGLGGISGAFCNPWAASSKDSSALARDAGTAAPRARICAVAFYFASLAVIACMRADHCPGDKIEGKCLMEESEMRWVNRVEAGIV